MKKIIAFLSAITFLGSSTLGISACRANNGQVVEIKINNAPEEADNTTDPLTDYVYNNRYDYNLASINYLIALAAQLASDEIYYDDNKTLTTPEWNEFYHSKEWREESFSSFNYKLDDNKEGFSFRTDANKELIYQVNGNDASLDVNKMRIYWFITSPKDSPDSEPTKDTIKIPEFSEFTKKDEVITRQGYVHLYLLIGKYQIDFNALIDFNFSKIFDKNGIPLVMTNVDTFTKPFGDIKHEDAKKVADERIDGLAVKESLKFAE